MESRSAKDCGGKTEIPPREKFQHNSKIYVRTSWLRQTLKTWGYTNLRSNRSLEIVVLQQQTKQTKEKKTEAGVLLLFLLS